MEALVNWLTENIDQHHPIIIAALIHYNLVRIHAFDDGNGSGSRILMNLILMKQDFSQQWSARRKSVCIWMH